MRLNLLPFILCFSNIYAILDPQDIHNKTSISLEEISETIKYLDSLEKAHDEAWQVYYHVLPRLIRQHNLKIGCEIGVYMGSHCKKILETTNIVKLYLDFIFIDADHSYEAVKEDLELWYPKVRKGGIVVGDDYATRHPGVPRAVNEFFEKKDVSVCLDKDQPRIWIVVKPD